MVRNYKRKTEDKWSKQDLLEALTLINECKLKINDAARQFGISRATLYRQYQKFMLAGGKYDINQFRTCGGNPILTRIMILGRSQCLGEAIDIRRQTGNSKRDQVFYSQNGQQYHKELVPNTQAKKEDTDLRYWSHPTVEEDVLEKTIIDLRDQGFSVTSSDIKRICYEYCDSNTIPNQFNPEKRMASDDWYYGFLKRHPFARACHIKMTTGKSLNPSKKRKKTKRVKVTVKQEQMDDDEPEEAEAVMESDDESGPNDFEDGEDEEESETEADIIPQSVPALVQVQEDEDMEEGEGTDFDPDSSAHQVIFAADELAETESDSAQKDSL